MVFIEVSLLATAPNIFDRSQTSADISASTGSPHFSFVCVVDIDTSNCETSWASADINCQKYTPAMKFQSFSL